MYRRIHILLFTLIISFSLLNFAKEATAQLTGFDNIEFTITPNNPKPGEMAVATLDAYGIDINTLDLTWILNDKIVQKGKGLRVYSFVAGDLGSRSTLEVVGQNQKGQTLSKKISFSPAKVDILYEANSYTPPFYKGKPRFPYQGSLKLVAIPSIVNSSGKKISNNKIIFKWKDGNHLLKDQSGYGRNFLSYKSDNSLPKPAEITVEVSYPEEGILADETIKVEPVESSVVFYEDNPEYGLMLNKALYDNVTLDKEEIVVSALPISFGIDDKNLSTIKYKWVLSDKSIENEDNSVVLRNTSGKNGQANLSLQISNTIDYFQSARNSLKINFNKINNLSR